MEKENKKKRCFIIIAVICLVSSFVLFFLITFATIVFNMYYYVHEVSPAYLLFRKWIVPILQFFIPVILFITSIVLFIVSSNIKNDSK